MKIKHQYINVKMKVDFRLPTLLNVHYLRVWVGKKKKSCYDVQFSSVQSLSRVQLFVTPWTGTCQVSLFITSSWYLLKLMPIESIDAIQLSHPLSSPFFLALKSFPASGSFLMSQFFAYAGQRTEASASASVLQMNIQDWFLLGLTVGSPSSPRDS